MGSVYTYASESVQDILCTGTVQHGIVSLVTACTGHTGHMKHGIVSLVAACTGHTGHMKQAAMVRFWTAPLVLVLLVILATCNSVPYVGMPVPVLVAPTGTCIALPPLSFFT